MVLGLCLLGKIELDYVTRTKYKVGNPVYVWTKLYHQSLPRQSAVLSMWLEALLHISEMVFLS